MNPNNPSNPSNHILLTFDIEDWFQVENFKDCIPFSSWPNFELRVEKNTHRLLDLLDSIQGVRPKAQGAGRGHSAPCSMLHAPCSMHGTSSPTPYALHPTPSIKATFFVLGWIAERLPHLVREIHARGHEVASHGYNHELCTNGGKEELKQDLINSKKLLEDITGDKVFGYRAPSFSISDEILEIVREAGYLYDSSFNSFKLNKRYGKIKIDGDGKTEKLFKISDNLYELPVSNINIGRYVFPWGGGGYFRLIPFPVFKRGIDAILKKNNYYLFYLHPWEIDPEQPHVEDASFLYKIRHYANLKTTSDKLFFLLTVFNECSFNTCHQYLEDNQDFLSPLSKREAVKKFYSPTKSVFPVVQGTEKFAPPKSAGQE